MAESSRSILDILKVKKEPTIRTAVMVKYSQPEKPVVLKGKIEDKRAVTKINRDEILSKLGQKPPIQSEIPLSVVKPFPINSGVFKFDILNLLKLLKVLDFSCKIQCFEYF